MKQRYPVQNDKTLDINDDEGKEKSKPLHISFLFIIFGAAIVTMYIIYRNIPAFESQHRERLKLPTSFQDVKDISGILSLYTDNNYYAVMSAFGAVYLFLQTFSIPGSIFLSFLAGALFGVPVGVLFVCAMATLGATGSYMVSYYLCRHLVQRFFPDKLALFASELSKHRHHILNYLLFLRITPFLPNWFVNLAAPILGIAVRPFMIGTFFGVMPQTYFAVKAGRTLHSAVDLKSPTDIFDLTAVLTLGLLALLSVLPTLAPVKRFMNKLLASPPDVKSM